jgi:hypothetical protein
MVKSLFTQYGELENAIKRVRELHLQTTLMCAGCLDPSCPIEYEACQECGYDYPCATIKALEGADES